jgi:hypothetical protein
LPQQTGHFAGSGLFDEGRVKQVGSARLQLANLSFGQIGGNGQFIRAPLMRSAPLAEQIASNAVWVSIRHDKMLKMNVFSLNFLTKQYKKQI